MLTHGCAEAGAAPSHKKQAASCTSPWVTNTMTLLHSSLYSNYQKCCTCNAQPVLSLPRSAWRRNSNFALTRRRPPSTHWHSNTSGKALQLATLHSPEGPEASGMLGNVGHWRAGDPVCMPAPKPDPSTSAVSSKSFLRSIAVRWITYLIKLCAL